MDRTMVLTIAGFLAVAVVFIIAARIQGKRETAARNHFIAIHGWEELPETPAEVLAAFALLAPVKYQATTKVVSLERGPRRAFFFRYNSEVGVRDRGSTGYACLVEHDGPRPDTPIEVTRRVPLVERITPDKLDVGSPEFRKMWLVLGEQPGAAAQMVNDEVQRLLLAHDAGPAWVLDVEFIGPWILVGSHWAAGPEEWEYLVRLSRDLADAVGREHR